MMSRFDHIRNEQLQARLEYSETGMKYPENDINVCLRELQTKCVTEAARLSFAMFKARVYVKAAALGTATTKAETVAESRSKDMVEA